MSAHPLIKWAAGPWGLLLLALLIAGSARAQTKDARAWTVRDSIELTTLPESRGEDPIIRSSSGRFAAIVTVRGSLSSNANVYSVFVLDLAPGLTPPKARVVAERSCSGNLACIEAPR